MRRVLAFLVLIAALCASLPAAQLPRKAKEFVVQMPDGKQLLLTSYRGKAVVLALMFTTCSHCQQTSKVLSAVQKEYAGKGVQILGATFDADAKRNIAQFSRIFATGFPCGLTEEKTVMNFIQQPPDSPPFVPILVFIDKTGVIRSQYVGDETFLNQQEVNIRKEIDKLLLRK